MSENDRQHEIDRLRLLLQKAVGKKTALMIEIEPGEKGFRIIATGITPEHEMEATQAIADYLNILLKGAIRFSVAAMDSLNGWKADEDGALRGTLEALSSSPDALTPVPELSEAVGAVDPSAASTGTPTTRV